MAEELHSGACIRGATIGRARRTAGGSSGKQAVEVLVALGGPPTLARGGWRTKGRLPLKWDLGGVLVRLVPEDLTEGPS